jgi:hypothetical protein
MLIDDGASCLATIEASQVREALVDGMIAVVMGRARDQVG